MTNRYLSILVDRTDQEIAVLKALHKAGYFIDGDGEESEKAFMNGIIDDCRWDTMPVHLEFVFEPPKHDILKKACELIKDEMPDLDIRVSTKPSGKIPRQMFSRIRTQKK